MIKRGERGHEKKMEAGKVERGKKRSEERDRGMERGRRREREERDRKVASEIQGGKERWTVGSRGGTG